MQLKMLGLSHRTWPSFFGGGGGRGGMYVPSLNLKINKINVVLKRELCRCGYFTASLHRCCSFNPSVSLVNINVMLSDCLKSMLLV